jgi:hypothetical protein
MSRRNIENRISANYRQKLGMATQKRLDLTLVDHELVNKEGSAAKILIAFDGLLGRPSKDDIHRFVWASFDQKLMPIMDSARIHEGHAAIEMVVEAMRQHQAMEASKAMAPIVPGKKFVDTKSVVWETRAAEDGTKYLVRKSDENIDEILSERRKYVNAGATHVSFRKLQKSAGYANAQEGDTVEFYQGTTPMQGKLVSIGKDQICTISTGKVTVKIPRQAILRVIQHSSSYTNNKMKDLKNFYTQYLGPELAQKLTDPGDNSAEGSGSTNK